MKATGKYKRGGDSPLIMVEFDNNTMAVNEATYRRMGYSPDFADLPWEADYPGAKAGDVVWL